MGSSQSKVEEECIKGSNSLVGWGERGEVKGAKNSGREYFCLQK